MGEAKTILISGTFRGGTSIVANLFRAGGVAVTDQVKDNLEDVFLRKFFHEKSPDRVDVWEVMAQDQVNRERHGTYLFKYPALHRYFPEALTAFQNGLFFIVVRDPLAVVKSEARHPDGVHAEFMSLTFRRVLRDYEKAITLYERHPDKVHLISYEYLLNPLRREDEIRKMFGAAGLDEAKARTAAGLVEILSTTDPYKIVNPND